MLATKAQVDFAEHALQEQPAKCSIDVEVDEADSDPLAPARGIALGAALGMASIAVMALLGWWLF